VVPCSSFARLGVPRLFQPCGRCKDETRLTQPWHTHQPCGRCKDETRLTQPWHTKLATRQLVSGEPLAARTFLVQQALQFLDLLRRDVRAAHEMNQQVARIAAEHFL
jgi:hypothetical protein